VSISDIVKLFGAITELLRVLVWPGVTIFILVRFRKNLQEVITSLGELSLKGAGFEVSLNRKQAGAAAGLAAAAISRSGEAATPEAAAREARDAADIVAEAFMPQVRERLKKSTVLWVDDCPDNNIYERQLLEALGINFVLAKSTGEALDKINQQSFDAIISDMGLPPNPKAGYRLLNELQSSGDKTPFIIYSTSQDPEHVPDSIRRGVIGCTNNPRELFEKVLFVLSPLSTLEQRRRNQRRLSNY
jgi:CheY-like chemotaxis protein